MKKRKEVIMEKENSKGRKVDPGRVQILKMLPREIKKSLTIEETNAILYEEIWPDSLAEKLKDFLAED
jgi:hypothetical protein